MPGIDTYALVTKLQQAGFEPPQAEALTEAFKTLEDTTAQQLATKGDVKEASLQLEVKLETVKGDLTLLKWMIGALFGLIIPVFVRVVLKL